VRGDRGSGSVLAVALAGSIAALTALSLPLYMGLAARQAVAAAADAAALAAADTSSGRVPGYPCDNAGRLAAANGASLVGCELDGLVATVTAGKRIVGIWVVSVATAGPP
jgi:secretion/DNA translocation related TadE-like protein